MSVDVGDAGDQVNGSSGNNHGGLAGEDTGGSAVDLLASHLVDLVAVLLEVEVAEGHEVTSNFFESVALGFHSHHNVHLKDVLCAVKLHFVNGLLELGKLFNGNVEKLSGVRAGALDVDTEKTGISEVGVDAGNGVNEIVLLHKASDGAAVHALAGSAGREGSGVTDNGVHDVESVDVFVGPWDGLEGECDVGLGRFGPGAVFATDVLRLFALVLVLGDSEHISKTFLGELNVFLVVLDAGGNDEALLGGDVVHDEFLEAAGIEVADVLLHTEAGHTQSRVTVCSAEEELLGVAEGIELVEVVIEVVGLLVLGASDVGSENRTGLEGNINHNLEHINGVVLNALSLEVCALLVVVHGHFTAGHLDDVVVHGLVGVLEGLQVGVLEGEHGTGGLVVLITSSNVHQET